eukprot:TRINITY_DN515_c0_g2_i2.p1 TRINITY_DN515_c0_g2~~TRINITY_DN515_c0_g2_i2.p1  ORF type:complete len:572 (+),score=74.31 TRINITY_DN515_c0_g2_i2:2-1717(+)
MCIRDRYQRRVRGSFICKPRTPRTIMAFEQRERFEILGEFPPARSNTFFSRLRRVFAWKPTLCLVSPAYFLLTNVILIFVSVILVKLKPWFNVPAQNYAYFTLLTYNCLILSAFVSKLATKGLQFAYPNQRFIFFTTKINTSVGFLVWAFAVLTYKDADWTFNKLSESNKIWVDRLAQCLLVICVTSFLRILLVKILIEQVRFKQMSDILLKERCMETVAELSDNSNISDASVWSRMYNYISEEQKEFKLAFEFQNDEDCIARSKKFFEKYSKSDGELDFDEFNSVFGDKDNKKWSEKLFALFKQTKNGVITEDDFVITLVRMRQEQVKLVTNLQNSSDITGVLTFLSQLIFWPISIGISMSILTFPVIDFLLPFGTFFLTTAFIFGGTLSQCFSALMFLLLRNPYNVGDHVIVNGERHIINRIHLLTSEAYTTDGRFVILNHNKVSEDHVINLSRSNDWVFVLFMQVNVDVPKEKILELKRAFLEYCTNNSHEFRPSSCTMRVDSIDNKNQLFLNFWAPLKFIAWDNWSFLDVKHDLLLFLKDKADELELSYTLPTTPVVLNGSYSHLRL